MLYFCTLNAWARPTAGAAAPATSITAAVNEYLVMCSSALNRQWGCARRRNAPDGPGKGSRHCKLRWCRKSQKGLDYIGLLIRETSGERSTLRSPQTHDS